MLFRLVHKHVAFNRLFSQAFCKSFRKEISKGSRKYQRCFPTIWNLLSQIKLKFLRLNFIDGRMTNLIASALAESVILAEVMIN